MPYVAAKDPAGMPIKDREKLNPHIFALTGKMRHVLSIAALEDLSPEIRALADAIGDVAGEYDYEGAFAGELNYSLHMILFDLIPDARYWVAADITGMLEGLLYLFHRTNLSEVLARYNREEMESEIPFGEDRAFIDILEWVFVHLIRNSAPDDNRRSKRFILGVLRHIDMELYRRLWELYEDLQIEKNGDVPGYVLWRKKIADALFNLREERAGIKA